MRKLLVISSMVFLCSAVAYAQVDSWPEISRKLYDRCLGFNETIKDITLFMKMSNPSTEGSIVTESKLFQKRNKFRSEIMLEGTEGEIADEFRTIIIDDGISVWIVNPVMGKSQIPPSESAKYRGQWYCSEYIPAQAEVVGSEKIGDKECWILVVLDEDADFTRLWIDKGSLSIMKLESESPDGEKTFSIFSDHRRIEGDFEIPFRTDIYAGEDLISTIVVDSFAVNTGLPDELFDADAAASKKSPSADEAKSKAKGILRKPKR